MTTEDIALKLADFLVESCPTNFDKNTLPRDQSLLSLQILDSFGILNLITFVESTWQIEIPTTEITIENFDTVNGVASLIESKTGANA